MIFYPLGNQRFFLMYSNEKVDNANRVGKKCFVFSLPFFYTLKKKLVANHPIFRIKTYLSNVMVVFFICRGKYDFETSSFYEFDLQEINFLCPYRYYIIFLYYLNFFILATIFIDDFSFILIIHDYIFMRAVL